MRELLNTSDSNCSITQPTYRPGRRGRGGAPGTGDEVEATQPWFRGKWVVPMFQYAAAPKLGCEYSAGFVKQRSKWKRNRKGGGRGKGGKKKKGGRGRAMSREDLAMMLGRSGAGPGAAAARRR